MKTLRFAIFGTGFWARYQLAGWNEIPGAHCVALYNRTRSKAESLGQQWGIQSIYDDPEELLAREKPDFVDIITDVGTHAPLTRLAARHGVAVICQKPMATSWREAQSMVRYCTARRVPLFIHENFRWQTPIRALAATLKHRGIGRPFRARIDFISGFPVFENQPFLAQLEQFILTDLGSHALDVARYLFGEVRALTCHTQKIHRHIRGEDVATVLLEMRNGMTVTVNLAYAGNVVEREVFPETLVFVECEKGTAELAPGCDLRITTRAGTSSQHFAPPTYPWADPRYAVVHSSIVPCQTNLLRALQGRKPAETTGTDNLKTMQLVFSSYQSAASGRTVSIRE